MHRATFICQSGINVPLSAVVGNEGKEALPRLCVCDLGTDPVVYIWAFC